MKINFELEVGQETGVLGFALEELIRTLQNVSFTSMTPEVKKWVEIASRLNSRLETMVSSESLYRILLSKYEPSAMSDTSSP